MIRPFAEITIAGIKFTNVTDVQISSTWERFTDTATIILPSRLKNDGQNITVGEAGLFSRGDQVTIKMGYFPNLQTVFEGFVSDIFPDLPIRIECQDHSWLLKQTSVTLGFESVTLKKLIDDSLDQIGKNSLDAVFEGRIKQIGVNLIDESAELGSFKTEDASGQRGAVNFIGILEELKKTYSLVSFFQNGDLFIGSPYILTGRTQTTTEMTIGGRKGNVIDHSLIFINEEDVKIKVKAVSMYPDNTRAEVTVGDQDGELRSFFTYNVKPNGTDAEKIAELKKIAERELDKFKYSGFKGSFVTFGEPLMKHGGIVDLKDKRRSERNGKYLIDGVDTSLTFDGGFRQVVRLGAKVNV